MDIAAWLRELGLEHYAQVFRDSEIEPGILAELTDEDFKELGIPLGPRRKLAKAIVALSAEAATPSDHPAAVGSPATPPPQAERRQLTVLFCDLVGSTALAARLDPEDMGTLVRVYQDCCAKVVERWGGHVAKYMGDGVLAYFGWPQAHEDDAERAVRAGLGLTGAVERLAVPSDEALAARVGIATGLVMVGDQLGESPVDKDAVVGETPHLAARLQTVAQPGNVVIAPLTRALLGRMFELEDLGPQDLKGFARPVRAARVVRESKAESRFEALRGGALTPLVGREQEIALLLDRFERVKAGEGQVVLLEGEPGIGKSRIVQALCDRLRAEPHTRLRYYCSAHYTNSALYPVINQLERAAGLQRTDTAEEQLDKLEELLAQSAKAVEHVAPLFAALLSLPTNHRYPPLNLSPQGQKVKTLEALMGQLAGLADQRPVLLIFEDAHWIDPTTLELLDRVVDRVLRLSAFVLITFRSEFSPPWTSAHVTPISLGRLTQHHAATMVEGITTGKALPPEIMQQILDKTDGVPLFVEELTKTVLQSGLLTDQGDHYGLIGPLPPLAIPTTLHDSLVARLDRLAPIKEVAQIGAVIGREFSHRLLATVSPLRDNELRQALDQLVDSGLVFQRAHLPEIVYSFKHALVQDAAYESLLRTRRQQLHARIGQVLESQFPSTVELQPEIIAHHYANAGLINEALPYFLKAGRLAYRRSAIQETIVHLHRGLELLKRLPDGHDRDQIQVDYYATLGSAFAAAKGYASSEAEAAFEEAHRLCDQIGDIPRIFPVLYGLFMFHMVRGDLQMALSFGKQLLRISETTNVPLQKLVAETALGSILWFLGQNRASDRHVRRALAIYDNNKQSCLESEYGQYACVSSLAFYAYTNLILGYFESALKYAKMSVEMGRALGNPFNFCASLDRGASTLAVLREKDLVLSWAEECIGVSKEQGFPHYLAEATAYKGWVLAQRGDAEEGIAQIEEGIAGWRGVGACLALPWLLGLLADAFLTNGRLEQALMTAGEADAWVVTNGEHQWESFLLCIRGTALHRLKRFDESEVALSSAIDVARQQDAKGWELRAALALARSWAEQGRRHEARHLLAPVYGWFTEGFSTADLKDAKAMLDELA